MKKDKGDTEWGESKGFDILPGETDPLLASTTCSQSWFQELHDHFGIKFLIILSLAQHWLKGFSYSFTGQAEPYLYRAYKVPAPRMQVYQGLTSLPWAMKPVIGLLSDLVPIMGYNKAPYIVITSVIGGICYFSIGLIPESHLALTALAMLLFACNAQQSFCDLLTEAKYAEKMQARPEHGPALLSFVWGGMNFLGTVATLFSGPVIDTLGPKAVYTIVAVPAAAIIAPTLWGYLGESTVSPEQQERTEQRFRKQSEVCALCIVTFGASLLMLVVGLVFASPELNAVAALVAFAVMLLSFTLVLSPVIAKFNAFSLIQTALTPSVSGAAYFFYTDTAEQYPEGPHFSPFFYNSVLGTVMGVLSLLGIYIYQKYFSTWSYRWLLVVTNVIVSVLSMLDVIMFARLNVRWGIPDHVFVLGAGSVQVLVGQMMYMPQVVILAALCPKGMEATMYALLAGCHNLGSTISANIGALMLKQMGVAPSGATGESAQFDNLWKASVVATLCPFLVVCALFWLVPEGRQTERILGDDEEDATTGSLLQRWRGEEGGEFERTTSSTSSCHS